MYVGYRSILAKESTQHLIPHIQAFGSDLEMWIQMRQHQDIGHYETSFTLFHKVVLRIKGKLQKKKPDLTLLIDQIYYLIEHGS